MFENIGSKLKTAATIIATFSVICGLIGLIISIGNFETTTTVVSSYIGAYEKKVTNPLAVAGLISSIFLIISGIFNAFLFYGVGEAVTKTETIIENQSRNIQRLLDETDNIKQLKYNEIEIEEDTEPQEKIVCNQCGSEISSYPCPFCNYEEDKE